MFHLGFYAFVGDESEENCQHKQLKVEEITVKEMTENLRA